MTDPLTLGALGAVVLTEGIKFLYEQGRELLTRWRAKRDRDVVELELVEAAVLDAPLTVAEVPESRIADHADTISALRRELIDYAEEGRPATPDDRRLLERVDALRRSLEVVYGQRITFKGEARPHTGTRVDVAVEAGVVEGYMAGLRAEGGLAGVSEVHSEMRVDRVGADGTAVGVDLGKTP